MATVKNVEILDEVVRYTVEHGDEEREYDISRAFSAEEADRTLLSYLRALDADPLSVDDWSISPKELTVIALEQRTEDTE